MKCETLHLKDIYPFLGEDGRDAVLDCYRPYNMPEMHREGQKRKTLLICPGGGYQFVSEREGEPVALHFLAAGYNVFVLHYSVDTHRFPAQLCEVAAAVELIRARADAWNCDAERLAQLLSERGETRPALVLNRVNERLIRSGEMRPPQALAQALDLPLAGVAPESPAVYRALLAHRTALDCGDRAVQDAVERIAGRLLGADVPLPEYAPSPVWRFFHRR